MTENEIGCDNCYYTYFDERAYPCSLCIRGIERTDMWQPSKKTKADRKTENGSEKPNNCECEPRKEQNFCGKCRYLYRDFKYGLSCYRLMDNEPCKYEERKDEPTISKMEQVDKDINVRSKEPQLTPNYCGTCKYREVPCGDLPCDMCKSYSAYEPKDEPQTERSE